MALTKNQRKLLSGLAELANKFGSPMDYTSTSYQKLAAIQQSYMATWHVLYGAICDDPENDFRDEDVEKAFKKLEELKALSKVEFPDRNGNLTPSPNTKA